MAQIAGILGVNPQTIRNWIKQGEFTATRSGTSGNYIILKSSLLQFLNKYSTAKK
ncbi:MAG: helix-turn-helix domain-containing protein [Thermodesulfobacteriota bacterium]